VSSKTGSKRTATLTRESVETAPVFENLPSQPTMHLLQLAATALTLAAGLAAGQLTEGGDWLKTLPTGWAVGTALPPETKLPAGQPYRVAIKFAPADVDLGELTVDLYVSTAVSNNYNVKLVRSAYGKENLHYFTFQTPKDYAREFSTEFVVVKFRSPKLKVSSQSYKMDFVISKGSLLHRSLATSQENATSTNLLTFLSALMLAFSFRAGIGRCTSVSTSFCGTNSFCSSNLAQDTAECACYDMDEILVEDGKTCKPRTYAQSLPQSYPSLTLDQIPFRIRSGKSGTSSSRFSVREPRKSS
jgi:hypothetical protein